VAWTQGLAFDLATGRWVYLDAHERGISSDAKAPTVSACLGCWGLEPIWSFEVCKMCRAGHVA